MIDCVHLSQLCKISHPNDRNVTKKRQLLTMETTKKPVLFS